MQETPHNPTQPRRARARLFPAVGLLVIAALLTSCGQRPRTNPPPNPASAPGIFKDAAAETGLSFQWGHGGKSPLNIIETLGHGCAFLDFDQDGLLDIFLVGTPRCALFRNTGARFQDVTKDSGISAEGRFFGIAVGDIDNDAFPDLYVTGYGNCRLYRNKAGKGFEDITPGSGVEARGPYDVATAAAFVDLDSDGKLDLFVGRYVKFTPDTLQYCTYSGVKAGCGVKNYDSDVPGAYRNVGGGKFKDITAAWGFGSSRGKTLGVAVRAPESGRGAVLYVANDEEPCDLFVPRDGKYVNEGVTSGTAFSRDGLTQAGMGADWGDYNLDGKPDLIVATFQTEPKPLYRAEGNGLYSEVGGPAGIGMRAGPYVAWTARFFDYDNDRWPDLLFTNGHTQDNVQLIEKDRTYPQPILLFHNEGGERFTDVGPAGGPAFQENIVGRGAAFGDYDNDGAIDVLIVDDEGAPLLLHNEAPNRGTWLGIKLVGRRSNRDGIAARVEVTTRLGKQAKDHQLAGGYISAHDPRVHFGLGKADSVERLRITWPSGQVDNISAPPVNRYMTIEEGAGRWK